MASDSSSHEAMGGCCHARPHWEQFRVERLAQGHNDILCVRVLLRMNVYPCIDVLLLGYYYDMIIIHVYYYYYYHKSHSSIKIPTFIHGFNEKILAKARLQPH